MRIFGEGAVLTLMRIPKGVDVAHRLQLASGDGDGDTLAGVTESAAVGEEIVSTPELTYPIPSVRGVHCRNCPNATFPDEKATFAQIFEIWGDLPSHDPTYRSWPFKPI